MIHIHRNADGTYYIDITIKSGTNSFRFYGNFERVGDGPGTEATDKNRFVVNIPVIIDMSKK